MYILFLYCKSWNTIVNTSDNINYQLSSTSSNGAQTVGNILSSVGFSVTFNKTNAAPNITTIQFNGITICSNGNLHIIFFFYYYRPTDLFSLIIFYSPCYNNEYDCSAFFYFSTVRILQHDDFSNKHLVRRLH